MIEEIKNKKSSQQKKPLNVVTISKADSWVDDVLPRFAAYVDAHCTPPVHRHLLLLDNPDLSEVQRKEMLRRLRSNWHQVVLQPPAQEMEGRLLSFDALRAGILSHFGLQEGLYIDPDTDIIEDLQGIQELSPAAELLWVKNPLPLQPVIEDLRKNGFQFNEYKGTPITLEPGFLYLRTDLSASFLDLVNRYPNVHQFAPGSTYWNMLMLQLGPRASQLPDDVNSTFWDVPSSAGNAKSVHFTGQWKRLQPFISYERSSKRIIITESPASLPEPLQHSPQRRPSCLSVIAILRDCADYLPHAFARFEAWENSGISVRYTFLENDSLDATPDLLRGFMKGRQGNFECKQLAVAYDTRRASQSFHRIMPLARMRNHALELARSTASQENEWTVFLDADIYFPENILEQMFLALAQDPAPDQIGLATCYTQQLYPCEQVPHVGRPVKEWPELAKTGHYYDTFAYRDIHHHSHQPFCGFAQCRSCDPGRLDKYPLPLVPENQAVVDVASAFGGFALLPTAITRDERIRWSTYSDNLAAENSMCEHVIFCDRLRTIASKRVVVLQNVNDVYRFERRRNSGSSVHSAH